MDASTTAIFNNLLPVMVGGGIAILGSFLGPPFLHLLQRRAERHRRLADKFEELVSLLYEHRQYLDSFEDVRVFEKQGAVVAPNPMPKIQAIVDIYFPQFRSGFHSLRVKSRMHEQRVIQIEMAKFDAGDKVELDAMQETFAAYFDVFADLEDELRAYARTHFG